MSEDPAQQNPIKKKPAKYLSRSQTITGYWKQTLDHDFWNQWFQDDEIQSTLWTEPQEDLSSWPDDRVAFVRLAKKQEGVADGAAHRLWMFVKGMQIGDRIIAHGDSSSIWGVGTVRSDYRYIDGRHARQAEWSDTALKAFDKDILWKAIEGQNLWGLTPIEPHTFKTLAQSVGYQGPLDVETRPAYINNLIDWPFIEPYTGWDTRMAQQMVDSIGIANDENPSSWVLHSWNNEPYLGIGSINAISVGPTAPYGFLVSNDSLDDSQRESIEPYIRRERTFAGLPWANYLWVPPSEVDVVLETAKKSHEEAVRRLARTVKTRANRWKWHVDEFRTRLEEISGEPIPQPAYYSAKDLPRESENEVSTFSPITAQRISEQFASSGLTYSDDQIATFYTAL